MATRSSRPRTPEAAADQHEKFHDALLRVTGNQFLVTIGTILHRFFWEFGYRDDVVRKPPPQRLLEQPPSIVRMIRPVTMRTSSR